MTLQEFDKYINTGNHLGCKIYHLFKDYHEALYLNNILPIDVFTNKSDLEDYAKILQAFARRGIDVKNDVNLQEFLHGKATGSRYYNQFQDAVKQMEDCITGHRKNHQEVQDIKEKNTLLKKLRDLKVIKDNAFVKYNNAKFYFNNHRLAQINEEIKQTVQNYFIAKASIKELKYLKIKTLQECDTKLAKLISEEDKLKKEKDKLQVTVSFFSIVDEALKKLSLKTEKEVKESYTLYKKNEVQINRYIQLQKQLQLQSLENDFNTLDHNKTFKGVVDQLQEEIIKNEVQVKQYKDLIKFNDFENPKSMAYWVINKGENLNLKEESIIRHFFSIDTIKPEKIDANSTYLPKPNKILETLKNVIEEPEKRGFWITLSGLYVFIEEVEEPIFNTANIDELKKVFQSNNQDLKIKLEEKEKILQTNKKLHEFVLEYLTEPESDLKVWQNRNNLQQQTEHQKEVFIRFEEFDFDNEITKYPKKEEIIAVFEKVKKELKHVGKEVINYGSIKEQLSTFKIHKIQEKILNLKAIAKEQKIVTEPTLDIIIDKDKFIIDFTTQHKTVVDNLDIKEGLEESIESKNTVETELDTHKLKYPYVVNVNLEKTLNKEEDYKEVYGAYEIANTNYWVELKGILISYGLNDKEEQLKGEQSFIQLAKMLFPSEIFKNVSFDETSILDEIEKYLEKIIDVNARINQNKLLAIKDILDDLKTEVGNQIEINKEIKKFFKEDYTKITGDNNASLKIQQSSTVSLNWVASYLKKLATVDIGLFDYQESLNAKNEKLPSLEDKLLYAYQEFSKIPEPNMSARKLLNPFSYYNLDYSIVTKSGKRNSGSTGQTYTSIALLCIAKLSLKNGSSTNKEPILGLRFMSIDEAEGIGSNFDMLSKIAKLFDYQIISLSISPNKLKRENQYIYRLTKIANEERANHHPSVIFS
ncbi:hypothetical protein ACFO3O_12060 [Dokdonia ponticola]|uniref:MukB N-terminal domain-containing protein n=1 Tax=Dokdonia ponticola TaxID=2041041 RepID=A0ABV9HWW0_9FLAO